MDKRTISILDMLKLRLEGYAYQHIANQAGISRQRVQQLLSPPKEIRDFVINKYNGRCACCDLYVGKHGHVHHEGKELEHYNDIESLELLCVTCHHGRHSKWGFI